jgi:hypothetical protein
MLYLKSLCFIRPCNAYARKGSLRAGFGLAITVKAGDSCPMSEKNQPFIVIDDDEVSRGVLRDYLSAHKAEHADFPAFEVLERGEGAIVIGQGAFGRPVRVGAVIERLAALARQISAQADIAIGDYVLDSAYGRLVRGGGDAIDLTDKECELLVCLHKAGGDAVSRVDLLRDVWGYVDDLETHTLETHIYRLRQKIEADPAKPTILVTRDEWYALA